MAAAGRRALRDRSRRARLDVPRLGWSRWPACQPVEHQGRADLRRRRLAVAHRLAAAPYHRQDRRGREGVGRRRAVPASQPSARGRASGSCASPTRCASSDLGGPPSRAPVPAVVVSTPRSVAATPTRPILATRPGLSGQIPPDCRIPLPAVICRGPGAVPPSLGEVGGAGGDPGGIDARERLEARRGPRRGSGSSRRGRPGSRRQRAGTRTRGGCRWDRRSRSP